MPDSRTRILGAFLFEQREFGTWSLELGGRIDRQEVSGAGLDGYAASAVNLSAGVILPIAGNLPRIPPLRIGAELAYARGAFGAALSARHSFEQDRVATGELPTDGYTLLDAGFTWRAPWGEGETLVFVRATNLLDEDARVHSSPLKDEVPLAGRSLAAGLRVSFGG